MTCEHYGIARDMCNISYMDAKNTPLPNIGCPFKDKKQCGGYVEKTTGMTMKEAFDNCADDDIPYNNEGGGYNNSPTRKKTKSQLLKDQNAWDNATCLSFALSDKWQIQRAEPKVLTGRDWWGENRKDYIGRYFDDVLPDAFKAGQKAEWIRHKELRWAAKYGNVDDIDKELANLKPPV